MLTMYENLFHWYIQDYNLVTLNVLEWNEFNGLCLLMASHMTFVIILVASSFTRPCFVIYNLTPSKFFTAQILIH